MLSMKAQCSQIVKLLKYALCVHCQKPGLAIKKYALFKKACLVSVISKDEIWLKWNAGKNCPRKQNERKFSLYLHLSIN